MDAYEEIRLLISEETVRLMESRAIQRDELQKVIFHAETTGEKFFNPSTGHSLAFLKLGRVTYWVRYSQVGEGYRIHSAYSHRMEMKRGR
jgi:hypothetical protein